MQTTPLKIQKEKRKFKFNYNMGFLTPYLIILILLILLPMIAIFFYSLIKRTSTFPIYSVTINNYINFFKNAEALKALLKSLYFALISTIGCLLVSYPIAYFIAKRKPKTQATLITLVTSPMWINMLLRTLALKQIFDGPLLFILNKMGYSNNTLLGNDFAIITGMIYVYIPYMILPIYTILSKIDYKLSEASLDLGGTKLHTFTRVILPLSLPGIMSGFTIVFLSSATTIVISKYLGGGKYTLIGNIIETEFISNSRWSYGSAISIILLIVIMLLLWLTSLVEKKTGEEV